MIFAYICCMVVRWDPWECCDREGAAAVDANGFAQEFDLPLRQPPLVLKICSKFELPKKVIGFPPQNGMFSQYCGRMGSRLEKHSLVKRDVVDFPPSNEVLL